MRAHHSHCALVRLTNAVPISFTPQPAPLLTSISSSSPPSVSNCLPGRSTITIQRRYFYPPVSLYIGDELCAPYWGARQKSSTRYTCIVPLIDYYTPGLYYDVVMHDTVYANEPQAGVLSSAVAFVPGPSLSSFVPCINALTMDGYLYANCQPGEQLAMTGTGFLPADPNACITITGSPFRIPCSGQCTSLVVLDDEHLVCTLPDLGPVAFKEATFTLYANGNKSLPLGLYPYDSDAPIIVTSLTGCGGQSSIVVDGVVTLAGCVPGESYDLYGSDLPVSFFDVPNTVISYYPLQMNAGSCTHKSGTLPGWSDKLVWDTPMLWNIRTVVGLSNPLAIVFATTPRWLPEPNSSGSSSTGSSSPSTSSTGSSGGSSSSVSSSVIPSTFPSSGSSSCISSSPSSSAYIVSSTSSSGSGGSSDGAGTSGSTASSGNASSNSSSGLSHGAVAGKVIDAVVVVLLALATLMRMCRLRSNKRTDLARYTDHMEHRTDQWYGALESAGMVELQ